MTFEDLSICLMKFYAEDLVYIEWLKKLRLAVVAYWNFGFREVEGSKQHLRI